MSPADVLQLIKDKGVKFVDLRLTDTKGQEQHVTVPSHTVDEDFFENGKMFDGSSIAGWKGINESDMILMPATDSADETRQRDGVVPEEPPCRVEQGVFPEIEIGALVAQDPSGDCGAVPVAAGDRG